jgi:hypothetical protein
MTIKLIDQEPTFRPTQWKKDIVISMPLPGFGLMYEADAVARSLRGASCATHQSLQRLSNGDGDLENARMPHDETRMVLEVCSAMRNFVQVR